MRPTRFTAFGGVCKVLYPHELFPHESGATAG